jgi:hypothetical protein
MDFEKIGMLLQSAAPLFTGDPNTRAQLLQNAQAAQQQFGAEQDRRARMAAGQQYNGAIGQNIPPEPRGLGRAWNKSGSPAAAFNHPAQWSFPKNAEDTMTEDLLVDAARNALSLQRRRRTLRDAALRYASTDASMSASRPVEGQWAAMTLPDPTERIPDNSGRLPIDYGVLPPQDTQSPLEHLRQELEIQLFLGKIDRTEFNRRLDEGRKALEKFLSPKFDPIRPERPKPLPMPPSQVPDLPVKPNLVPNPIR